MLHSISRQLRRYARLIWAQGNDINPGNIHTMFDSFVNFLEHEPAENFSYSVNEPDKGTPLDMPKDGEAEKHFRAKVTPEFPERTSTGLSGYDHFNFLYLLGQALVGISFIVQGYDDPSFNEGVQNLFQVWGGERQMSAGALITKYLHTPNAELIPIIVKKMKESSDIARNKIAPNFKSTD